jgi:hypothetical protein
VAGTDLGGQRLQWPSARCEHLAQTIVAFVALQIAIRRTRKIVGFCGRL